MRREDEPEEFEIADSYFQELRTWLGFRDSHEAWIPEAGSRLAQDDGLIKPHQASHNIANAVVSAIDHLHALDSIMLGAGASHTLAPFSLVRAAIECAAQAAWISAPEEQATRIVRSLSLSLKVAKDRETAYSELTSPSESSGNASGLRQRQGATAGYSRCLRGRWKVDSPQQHAHTHAGPRPGAQDIRLVRMAAVLGFCPRQALGRGCRAEAGAVNLSAG